MRIHKMLNGMWIDLDHIAAVKPLDKQFSSIHYLKIHMMFMNEPLGIGLRPETAQLCLEDLIKAWKED